MGNENRSIYRLRWVGYGLLLLSLFDVINLLIPPQFMNPAWEFQTIGQLVERVPLPLLGLALIFFGEWIDRSDLERLGVKLISWLSLLLAIIYLVLVPLGVINTARLNSAASDEMNKQVEARLSDLKQLEEKINTSKPEEIKNLGAQLQPLLQARGSKVDANNPEALKTEVVNQINVTRSKLNEDAKAGQGARQTGLFKNSIKWGLGSLISSALFFLLWRSSDWTRKGEQA
jgi:Skp family chaperone for outer membrane proteins